MAQRCHRWTRHLAWHTKASEGWLVRAQAMHKTSHPNCKGKDGIGLTAGCKVLRVERIENMLLWKQYCTGPAALEPQPS